MKYIYLVMSMFVVGGSLVQAYSSLSPYGLYVMACGMTMPKEQKEQMLRMLYPALTVNGLVREKIKRNFFDAYGSAIDDTKKIPYVLTRVAEAQQAQVDQMLVDETMQITTATDAVDAENVAREAAHDLQKKANIRLQEQYAHQVAERELLESDKKRLLTDLDTTRTHIADSLGVHGTLRKQLESAEAEMVAVEAQLELRTAEIANVHAEVQAFKMKKKTFVEAYHILAAAYASYMEQASQITYQGHAAAVAALEEAWSAYTAAARVVQLPINEFFEHAVRGIHEIERIEVSEAEQQTLMQADVLAAVRSFLAEHQKDAVLEKGVSDAVRAKAHALIEAMEQAHLVKTLMMPKNFDKKLPDRNHWRTVGTPALYIDLFVIAYPLEILRKKGQDLVERAKQGVLEGVLQAFVPGEATSEKREAVFLAQVLDDQYQWLYTHDKRTEAQVLVPLIDALNYSVGSGKIRFERE